MTLPITIARRAESDLTLQYQWYLEQAGLEVAERFLQSVDSTIHSLAAQPEIGFRRRFRAPELQGIRSSLVQTPFDKHLIFYRADDNLSIERVMHSARDLPRRLLQEPGAE